MTNRSRSRWSLLWKPSSNIIAHVKSYELYKNTRLTFKGSSQNDVTIFKPPDYYYSCPEILEPWRTWHHKWTSIMILVMISMVPSDYFKPLHWTCVCVQLRFSLVVWVKYEMRFIMTVSSRSVNWRRQTLTLKLI